MVSKYHDSIENDEIDPESELYFERQPIIGISIPGEKHSNSRDESTTSPINPVESCLINIYDQQSEERNIRLNDMIEVIGICSINFPTEYDINTETEEEFNHDNFNDQNEMNNSENKLEYPRKKQKREIKSSINMEFLQEFSTEETELLFSHSSSYSFCSNQQIQSNIKLKYKIDCLFYEKIQSSYPLYSSICDSESLSEDLILNHSFQLTEDQMISYIPQLFNNILNDSLVSQYLTYGILSHVYSRTDLINPVGNLPLNIINSPSYDSIQYQQLIETIRNIAPRVVEVIIFLLKL